MPVHHGAQVGVTTGHEYVRNVGTPDLVGPLDGEFSQHIWVFTVPVVRDAGARLAPNRLVAHLTAQAVHALAVDLYAVFAFQHSHEPPTAEARVDQVDFVQQSFDANFFRIFSDWILSSSGTRHAKQLALPSHADYGMLFVHQLGTLPHRPSCLDFFVNHTNSMACWPIFAWKRSRSNCSASALSALNRKR